MSSFLCAKTLYEMNNHRRISVIVPCHNRSEMLFECLNSIAQQTYQEIELILVDDASTEDIESVLKKIHFPFRLPQVYIRSEKNIGPGAARELGRLKATGDFICYLDSDDYWHPQKIEKQLQVFKTNPELGMCYCASMNVDQKTGEESIRFRSDKAFERTLPIILVTRPWGTGACMWATWATDNIGPWFSGWGREDIEYDLRAGCLDIPIQNIPEVLCYYRINSDEQLRYTPRKKLIRQFISPELKMAENLILYSKVKDTFIRKRMIMNLYQLGMEFLGYDDHLNAKTCWNMIWRLAKRDFGVYMYVIAAYLLSPIKIGRMFLVFLNRGIRFLVIPLYVRKGEFQ